MKYAYLLLAVLFLSACDAPEMPLPGITGKAGELVLVMDDAFWNGPAGDTTFNVLSQHIYGLPQAEPMFNVVHVKSSAFTKIFQSHRNIVTVNIAPEATTTIQLKTDKWATPQVVVEITAPTVDAYLEIFASNAARIIGHVLKKEEERILKSYRAQEDAEVIKPVEVGFGVRLSVPKGYHLVRQEENFCWIRYETKDVTQSILIYKEPYTKTNTFSVEGMIEGMDTFSKEFVPGPDAGTYMSTVTEYPPRISETSINGKYASKLVGLWHIEHALMGGPFVSYSMLDASEKNVLHLHGFVFAPGKTKRNYLRQVDAIINSAQLQ
ncbi:MAG: DUF4837 family protein [Flavobacteriales bacterium]|nr:DUF4837 family protein [Flavobacteriales bacterium]